MTEYLIQSSSLKAIADEVRTLSGTTAAMGLDAMAENISNANTTIDSQEYLMSQIMSALEGKAGNVTKACSGEVSTDDFEVGGSNSGTIYYVNADMKYETLSFDPLAPVAILEAVAKGSIMAIHGLPTNVSFVNLTNVTLLKSVNIYGDDNMYIFSIDGDGFYIGYD